MMPQHFQVFVAVQEQRLGQCSKVNLGDLLLVVARHREPKRRFGRPSSVELIMVRPVDPQQSLQFAVGNRWVGQIDSVSAVVGVVALETGDVSVAAAVN